MKFEFTDTVTNDTWIEEYPSLSHVPPEDLEGCTFKYVFSCNGCKKEVRTSNISDATIGLCDECSLAMDNNLNCGDIDDD